MFKKWGFLIALVSNLVWAAGDVSPELKTVRLDQSYIPVGFDSNDNVQVTVAGFFTNSNYRVGPTLFKVDENKKIVWLEQKAYVYNEKTLPFVIPFSQVVTLGIIKNWGDYRLVDRATGKDLGTLPVEEARTSAADEVTYAHIHDAFIVQDPKQPQPLLHLNVELPNRCSKLLPRVRVYEDRKVIVVRPIVVGLDEQDCVATETRYSHPPIKLKPIRGVYLLHVRVLNGQAINKMVEVF